MKHLLLYLLISIGVFFSVNSELQSQESKKVLLFIRDGSGDLDYTLKAEVDIIKYPEFIGGVYSGTGVLKDGNIITSGVCPYLEKLYGFEDGTDLLTESLIIAINEEAK